MQRSPDDIAVGRVPFRVLVACEFSGTVREAFRAAATTP